MTPRDRHLVWAWFRRSWQPERRWLAFIVVTSVVNAVIAAGFPWLWQYLVDGIHEGGTPSGVAEVGVWMMACAIAQSSLYVFLQGARTLMNARIQRGNRARVFRHLTTLDEGFFRSWRSGDLVTRLTDDAGEKTSWFLCSGVFRALEAALIVVACLAAMVIVDPWLALLVSIPLPVLLVAQAWFQAELQRRHAEVQAAISGINDELATTFGGIRIVQACGLAPSARSRFLSRADQQRAAEIRVARLNQGVTMMYGSGWQLAVGVLLLVGGPRVMSGEVTLGEFVAFEGFVMTLVWPMFDVGTFVSRYMQAGVALGRLQDLMEVPPPTRAARGRTPRDHGVRVRGLSVVADGAALLDHVDVELPAGRMIAVVGEVGCGKSTLLRALAGAVPPSSGEVAVGGVAWSEADPHATRAMVAYVPQDPVVLSLTVRDNVLLGRELGDDALRRALHVSRLEQDLGQLPDGLDTAVGERGVTLSGGQQQRLALARALVGAPRVLLLDDATAALDADTEAAFWNELESVLPDVTAVVVTHRPATIERADEVLVFEHGRMVQRGRHADLIATDGTYRRVYGKLHALQRVHASDSASVHRQDQ